MFMSVLVVYHLFHKKSTFLQKFRFEIVYSGIVEANVAKHSNTSKVSPLPKQIFIVY